MTLAMIFIWIQRGRRHRSRYDSALTQVHTPRTAAVRVCAAPQNNQFYPRPRCVATGPNRGGDGGTRRGVGRGDLEATGLHRTRTAITAKAQRAAVVRLEDDA